jgi:hypothetical protein
VALAEDVEVIMKQKQIFIILGAIGLVFVLFWFAVVALVIKNLRGLNEGEKPPVIDVTLCDEDASDLCVVTFGANSLNQMVITFQLPNEVYPVFYVKAANRGIVSVYTCEASKALPTSVSCSGVRTPLGETIDIEVYTTNEDNLIARGTFLISAIALSTPIALPTDTPIGGETPTSFPYQDGYASPTPTLPFQDVFPTQTESTETPTPTPDTAYPNP